MDSFISWPGPQALLSPCQARLHLLPHRSEYSVYLQIYLRFMEYQMEHSNECKKNFVAVYDGSSAIENLKAKFCSTVANDVMLDNGVGVVRMWADEKSRLSRFRMLFTSFVDRECRFFSLLNSARILFFNPVPSFWCYFLFGFVYIYLFDLYYLQNSTLWRMQTRVKVSQRCFIIHPNQSADRVGSDYTSLLQLCFECVRKKEDHRRTKFGFLFTSWVTLFWQQAPCVVTLI